MRILTVTNVFPPDLCGGYELRCDQAVRALQGRGHAVHVLTSRPRSPVPQQPHVTRSLRLSDSRLIDPHRRMGAGARRLWDAQGSLVDGANVGALLDAIAVFEPDAVYLWNVAFVGALGIAGALAHLQLPVLWHLMDDLPRAAVTVDGRSASAVAAMLGRRMRGRFIACSGTLIEEIAAGGFDFAGRVGLVPNWVDPIPAPRDRPLYPDAAAPLRVASAGDLALGAGVDVIIEAARRLLELGLSGFTVDIFGEGSTGPSQRLLIEHDLEATVRLGGPLPHAELTERLWDYDIFLYPTSQREPFTFTPAEAAARGCAPMISEEWSNAEWFEHGVDCIKLAPQPDRVADGLADVLQGRVALGPIAVGARGLVERAFSIEHVLAAIEDALGGAVEEPSHRPGRPDETYHLARLAERLALEWAEQTSDGRVPGALPSQEQA